MFNLCQEYVENILKTYCINELSYFECNIETWRQLWRVLEMSDIVLLIADIRHPVSTVCFHLLNSIEIINFLTIITACFYCIAVYSNY